MPACEHKRTEFLMRRDGVDYLHCVDCSQVFESDDLEQVSVDDDSEEEPRQKKAS
jgi:Zn ribbon nucleic-acid-binding protein